MRHLITASEGAQGLSQQLFRARLDALIDVSHPLAKLARVMPWAEIDVAKSAIFPPAPVGAGRPALPIRLMAGLLYLKHAYSLSDEATCERWLENFYLQYFTGEVYFQTRLPCDPSSFTRWRNRLGEAGLEELLSQTIEVAKTMRAVTLNELRRVIRDIEQKIDTATVRTSLRTMLKRAEQLRTQHRKAKNKLYALHAPKVECISKGKSRHPYEFGVKVGIAITARRGIILGARAFLGTHMMAIRSPSNSSRRKS